MNMNAPCKGYFKINGIQNSRLRLCSGKITGTHLKPCLLNVSWCISEFNCNKCFHTMTKKKAKGSVSKLLGLS